MEHLEIIKNAYEKFQNNKEKKHFLIGFDGFVDEIIHVVDKRKNPHEYDRINYIKDFSERIAQVAGLSANIELVPVQTKVGGNGPIMANAVIAQEHDVTYMGALGKTQVNPVFKQLSEKCKRLVSIADPGHTDALEFYDGKIMLGKMDTLLDVSWDNLIEKISRDDIKKQLEKVDLIAFANWTMLSNLNSIIAGINNIIKELNRKPKIFIDLADPKKRTNEDILDVLEIISGLDADTVLSMNHSESTIISMALGLKEDDLKCRAAKIREKLNIEAIVIHPVNGAVVSDDNETRWIEGPYTPEPRLTTGAGDNFNAGFCNGWLNGLTLTEAIAVGVCTSGFYVREKHSPSKTELAGFMKTWIDRECGEV